MANVKFNQQLIILEKISKFLEMKSCLDDGYFFFELMNTNFCIINSAKIQDVQGYYFINVFIIILPLHIQRFSILERRQTTQLYFRMLRKVEEKLSYRY